MTLSFAGLILFIFNLRDLLFVTPWKGGPLQAVTKSKFCRDEKLLFVTACKGPPFDAVMKSNIFYPAKQWFAVNKVE